MRWRTLGLVPVGLALAGAAFALGPWGAHVAALDGRPPLEAAPAADAAELAAVLASLGAEGRARQAALLAWDVPVLVGNALVLLVLLRLPLRRGWPDAPRAAVAVTALALLPIALDLAENALLALALAAWPEIAPTNAAALALATRAKWAALPVAGGAALCLWVAFACTRARRPRRDELSPS